MSKKTCYLLSFLVFTQLIAANHKSSAESYVGVQAGMVLGAKVSDGKGTVNNNSYIPAFVPVPKVFPDTDISTIDLDENFSISVKAGHYFKKSPFLGVEAELNYSKPDFNNQTLTFKNPTFDAFFGGPIGIKHLDADVHDINLAVSLMARARKFKHFTPYVGVGPNLHYFIVRGTGNAITAPGQPFSPALNGDDIKQDKISVGIQAKAGVRVPMTEHLAFDVEYKFNIAPVQMGEFRNIAGYKGDFTSHQVMAGLTYTFGKKY